LAIIVLGTQCLYIQNSKRPEPPQDDNFQANFNTEDCECKPDLLAECPARGIFPSARLVSRVQDSKGEMRRHALRSAALVKNIRSKRWRWRTTSWVFCAAKRRRLVC